MGKLGFGKILAIIVAVIVLGAVVFLGIDAFSDDVNVVFYPDSAPVQSLPDNEEGQTTQPTPEPDTGTGELTRLASPSIAYDQETNILSWNAVENASGYLVIVGGREYRTQQTQVELAIEENSQYSITIKALGDGEKYKDSEAVSLNGVRQELDKMYYQQIEDNIYKFFEDFLYAGRNKIEIQDILNIDLQNNVFSVLLKGKNQGGNNIYYRTFIFNLSEYQDFLDSKIGLKELAEASNYVKSYNSFVSNVSHATAIYDFGNDLYNKLISDDLLTGKLREYIDNGYTVTKLYSEPSMGNLSKDTLVNTCVKLQKDSDIKVVTVQNLITQKFNNSYVFGIYVNAYINGTAEDVKIEETSFTEASPVSSVWQAANDKYDNQ